MFRTSHMSYSFPYKTVEDEPWDWEWANDWRKIVDLYETIDHLEEIFHEMDVGYLRELTQTQLILNLRKYAYSLQKVILEKYGDFPPNWAELDDLGAV